MELKINLAEIHQQALTAARAASKALLDRYGGEDGFPCGFAWVKVYGVKLSTKQGKEFAKLGFSKSYSGGIELWNPSGMSVQNVNIKEAGASAYAEVLRRYDFQAYAGSRLD
jgi:hypothetical protein